MFVLQFCLILLRVVGVFGCIFDVEEYVGCVGGGCDGLERCFGVSVVCSVCGNGCVCGVRCLWEIFECFEVTRAFAVPHVCDCGIAWRPMVLGAQ